MSGFQYYVIQTWLKKLFKTKKKTFQQMKIVQFEQIFILLEYIAKTKLSNL